MSEMNETRPPETATYESYGGCSVQLPILPSHPAHLVELAAHADGLHLTVRSMDGVLLLASVSQWGQVAAWMEAATVADLTYKERLLRNSASVTGWMACESFSNGAGSYWSGVLIHPFRTLDEFCAHIHASKAEAETCASIEFELRKQGTRQWLS